MTELAWIAVGFLVASIPYSLLIGFLVFRLDIRRFGDGNPGATNVYRASGSKFWYIVAVCLDGFKGLFPVGIAHWIVGLDGWIVAAIGIACVAGHAFSPFLRFNGGKAVAVTGGIWTGLTIMEAPIVMAVLLVYWYKSVAESNWAVILWLLSFLAYLILTQRHPAQLVMWLGNFLIVLYRHRQGLGQLPTWQPWLPFIMRQS
jgi:glycerol-3-phosphate acyltransferase PlsY